MHGPGNGVVIRGTLAGHCLLPDPPTGERRQVVSGLDLIDARVPVHRAVAVIPRSGPGSSTGSWAGRSLSGAGIVLLGETVAWASTHSGTTGQHRIGFAWWRRPTTLSPGPSC